MKQIAKKKKINILLFLKKDFRKVLDNRKEEEGFEKRGREIITII